MKIKEVQDSVTDYYEDEPDDPDSPADAVQNKRNIKVFNADDNDFDKYLTNTIAKYQSIRETEHQNQANAMAKTIRAEFIDFGAEIFNKLKDKVLDITAPDQSANPQPDVTVLQSSRSNTTVNTTVQSSKFEHVETRRIEDIYNNIVTNASHIKETIATFVDDARVPVGDVSAPAECLADTDSEGKIINGCVVSTVTSNDSIFFIKKNSEDDSETDIELSIHTKISETKQSIYNLFKLLQVEEIAVNLLENKIVKLQTALPQKHSVKLCEKVARQDSEEVIERDNKSTGDNLETFSSLNKTYYKHSEDDSETNDANARSYDVTQHNRHSCATNSKSKRKDLLHRFEVLKTLQFDDETSSEGSLNECSPTVQSTQIQANLLTCSQGELDSEMYSNSGSNLDFDKNSKSESLRNLVSFSRNSSQFDDTFSKSGFWDTHVHVKQPSEVLIFDYRNPLNNILLRPINFTEAHKYNPMKTAEKIYDPKPNHFIDKHCIQVSKNDTTRSRSSDLNVRTVTTTQNQFELKTAQAADQKLNFSTPYSVDTERPNAETDNITKLLKDSLRNKFSSSKAYTTKAKKRICSLSTDKHRYLKSVKVTPQAKTKRQKISNTRKVQFNMSEEVSLEYESLHSLSQKKSTNTNHHSSKTSAKNLPKTKAKVKSNTKLEDHLFVQQLIADYIGFYENNNDHDNKLQDDINLNVDPNTQSFLPFSQSALSFSSSKKLNLMKGALSTSKQFTMQGMPFEPPSPKVLVFDYQNSLNNVLLTPIDATEAHKYKPMKTEKTTCGFEHSYLIDIHNKQESRKDLARDFEVRTVSIKQHFDVPRTTSTQQNQRSRFSKPHLVNTKEQGTKIDRIKNRHSHAKITRRKKRIRSPSSGKHRHLSFIDVKPKPVTKMQNISSNPKVKIKISVESAHNMMPKKDDTKDSDRNAHRSKYRGKRSSKILSFLTKVSQTKTPKQFISDFDTGDFSLKPDFEKHSLDDVHPDLKLNESLTAISQSGATFTLNKNLNPTKDFLTTSNTDCRSHHQFTMQVTPSQVDWPPELMCTTSPIKYDSDFGVNVVAKIDMLPFMGCQECKWETSSADTWSFRLLNGRLRLTVRLAHRLHNAMRTRVRGDTPVLDITVAAAQFDRADLVAKLCTRFTCASLRHMVVRAVRKKFYASDVPALLRRCATVVRVALRWKRAMYDAKARLAYRLDKCGNLSLKVANMPIRSVWEVKIQIRLVSDDVSSVPCPRACCVRVLPIVSDLLVPADDVQSVLVHSPTDWGHVPSTIWRVYRFLKHMKQDEDFLLARA